MAPAHVAAGLLVVHGFPGEAGQRGVVDAQVVVAFGGPVPAGYRAGAEQCAEQFLAHVPDPLLFGEDVAGLDGREQHRVPERLALVEQSVHVDGDLGAGFAGGGAHDLDPVTGRPRADGHLDLAHRSSPITARSIPDP